MRHELFEPVWTEHGFGTRLQDFQKLMRHRIRDVLLVSSLFDLYLFEEEGRLYEQIQNEYTGLQLSHTPELTRVSSGSVAMSPVRRWPRSGWRSRREVTSSTASDTRGRMAGPPSCSTR